MNFTVPPGPPRGVAVPGLKPYLSLPCDHCIGRSLNLCKPLDDARLRRLLALGSIRHWKRHETLFRAGDPMASFFKIRKGIVAVSRALDDGRRQIVAVRAPGDCVGYLDNDGDSDLVMFDNSGPMRVLSNNVGQRRHWLGVRVMDGRRDALQARVVLERSRSAAVVRRVQVDGSYCAASDPRIVFGLGHDAAPPTVRVYWPGGEVQEFRGLAIDRYWLLEPGKPARAAVS